MEKIMEKIERIKEGNNINWALQRSERIKSMEVQEWEKHNDVDSVNTLK